MVVGVLCACGLQPTAGRLLYAAAYNFDHPEAFDKDALMRTLHALKASADAVCLSPVTGGQLQWQTSQLIPCMYTDAALLHVFWACQRLLVKDRGAVSICAMWVTLQLIYAHVGL